MTYRTLTLKERMRIERPLSQAMYYAQRGFSDAARINVPGLAPEQYQALQGMVAEFLMRYVVTDLQAVAAELSMDALNMHEYRTTRTGGLEFRPSTVDFPLPLEHVR